MASSVGKIREIERYHGDPATRSGARARRTLDRALTSDKDFMKDAVSDTTRILQRSGQRLIDAKATSSGMYGKKKSQLKGSTKSMRSK